MQYIVWVLASSYAANI